MIVEQGDMWRAWAVSDLWLFTANAVLTADGRLVMGAGIAKQVRDKFAGVDLALGEQIEHGSRFGLLVSPLPATRCQTFRCWAMAGGCPQAKVCGRQGFAGQSIRFYRRSCAGTGRRSALNGRFSISLLGNFPRKGK